MRKMASLQAGARGALERRGAAFLVLVVAALVTSAILASVAAAVTGLERLGVFAAGPGAGDGQLDMPKRVAVEDASGNVLVVDQNNDRVRVFAPGDSGASYLTQFGAGVLDDPFGIAVDQDSGDVYVSSAATNSVVKFNSDGASVPTYSLDGAFTSPVQGSGDGEVGSFSAPLAFDQAADRLLVGDPSDNRIERFTEAGGPDPYASAFDGSASGSAFTFLKDLAVDADGDVLVVDDQRVERFAADGSHVGSLTGAPGSPDLVVAVPGGGEVLVGHNGFGVEGAIYRFASDAYADTLDQAPGWNGNLADPLDGFITGLAIRNGDPARLYAGTDSAFGFAGRVGGLAYDIVDIQAPQIVDQSADPTSYGARLKARLDTSRGDTTYYFEYGPTAAYGSRFPATDATVAGSADQTPVSKFVGGLQPGTTYHFRTVATNVAGTVEGPDRTFTTPTPQPPADPDDDWAYEMVTPVEKNGVSVDDVAPVLSSPDGNAVAFAAPGAYPGAEMSLFKGYYAAHRGEDDWSTSPVEPPVSNRDFTIQGATQFFAEDFSRAVQVTNRALGPDAIEGGSNMYMWERSSGRRLLTATSSPLLYRELSEGFNYYRPISASPDLSSITFTSSSALVPEAVEGIPSVYQWADGQLELLSRMSDGTPAAGAAGFERPLDVPAANIASADGRRVFFQYPLDPNYDYGGALYVRVDNEVTAPISVSRRDGDDATPRNARFIAASRDGQIVYFASLEPLTDDGVSTLLGQIYRYDVDEDELRLIGPAADPADVGFGSGFATAVSADGEYIYFQSTGRLTEDAVSGWNNLYAAHGSEIELVDSWDTTDTVASTNSAVSQNGRYFTFSQSRKVADLDNSGDCPAGSAPDGGGSAEGACAEVYLYDAVEEALRCVSCTPAHGANRHSVLPSPAAQRVNDYPRRVVLDDGTVFFDSDDALVAEDTNGVKDAYRWLDGEASLVSTGKHTKPSRFGDSTPDGSSVFFFTAEGLVGRDVGGGLDLYVRRAGGGLPKQDLGRGAGSACHDDACQGSRAATSAPAAPATKGDGDDGARRGPRASMSLRPLSEGQLAAFARGRVVAMKVRVNRSGRVALIARARVGERARTIASASRRAQRAGVVTLRLRLSKAGRRQIRSQGRLRVRFAVRFSGVAEPRSSTRVLRLGGRS